MTLPSELDVGKMTSLIPGFDVTQHQLTKFVIDKGANNANAVVYMQAEHFVREDSNKSWRTIGGYYKKRRT